MEGTPLPPAYTPGAGPHFTQQGLDVHRLQLGPASQAASCRTIPIFLVSVNSGKIFKYTKA